MVIDIIPAATRLRCAKMLAGAVAIYAALAVLGVQKLFLSDAEGLAALVQIVGTLYSVVYAFATYVIWGQFASVENEIQKESGALKDLLLFSNRLREAIREPMVRAVKIYARAVAETEWRALSHNETTEKTYRLFHEVISSVANIRPEGDAERSLYERLLDIANQASAHRDERLSLSSKRMPQTLFFFVSLTALTILFLLFLYPFRNPVLGGVSVAITTTLLFFAHFVLTDLDTHSREHGTSDRIRSPN
ncbi:MAG: hypothetical protein ABSD75_29225 [Terriglobales bacterium]|jgi:hypothetical protein